ncbi:MAG: hypothetical protein ACRDSJ_10525, partial [Rubrobacteraceae bacterium]
SVMTRTTKSENRRHIFARAALAVLVVGSLALVVGYDASRAEGAGGSAKVDREDAVEPFAGDVFVLDGAILRNPTGGTSPDAQLFNVAGTPLDVTWGEWKSASATSKARVVRKSGKPRTDVRVRLSGLVPEGVYSLFYVTFGPDSRHPLCPGEERSLPLKAWDPDQSPDRSSFVARDDGTAVFHARVKGRLLDAGQVQYLAIYHFDGMTYHPFPNRGEFVTHGDECRSSFGVDAMRQLIVWQKRSF